MIRPVLFQAAVLSLTVFFNGGRSHISAQEGEARVASKIMDVEIFVASGFDDNDLVEFVFTGRFSSPCFVLDPSNRAERMGENQINLRVKSIEDARCSESLNLDLGINVVQIIAAPFPGVLPEGEYELSLNGKHIDQKFYVEPSEADNEDNLILPKVELVRLTDDYIVQLEGIYLKSGMGISSFRLLQVSDQVAVIEPILAVNEGIGEGDFWKSEFKLPQQLVESSKKGNRTYLHVRSQQLTWDGRLISVPRHHVKFPR